MKSYSGTLNLMLKSAEKTYNILQRDFREIEFLQNSKKGSSDFALKTIQRVNSTIINNLSSISKFKNFFDLEGNLLYGDGEDGESFFLGIDGAENFEHSIASFSLVIASINKEQKLQSAIVYCPALFEYYIVEKGVGGWKEPISGFGSEHLKLKVSQRNIDDNILGSSGIPERSNDPNILKFNAESISIAYVASGKLDFHYLSIRPFSNLLAELFMNESGGKFTKNAGFSMISNINLG